MIMKASLQAYAHPFKYIQVQDLYKLSQQRM